MSRSESWRAWIVGWSLILEFTLIAASFAGGWSGYLSALMAGYGYALPRALAAPFAYGGVIDLPAVLIVATVGGLLAWRVRAAMIVNAALVLLILLLPLILFAAQLPFYDSAALPDYSFGPRPEVGGAADTTGIVAAIGTLFFLFTGFDAVAPAAEEAQRPARDIPIGILGSTIVAVVLFAAATFAAFGTLEYWHAQQDPRVVQSLFAEWASRSFGWSLPGWAVAVLPAGLFALLFAQSRILHAMARDRLLPPWLAPISGRGTPVRVTLFTAAVVAAIAAAMPFENIVPSPSPEC